MFKTAHTAIFKNLGFVFQFELLFIEIIIILNSKFHFLFLLIHVVPIAASAPKCLKNPWSAEEDSNQGAAKQEEPWPALADRTLVTLVEQLFSHLLKVINICAHVMDDVAPGPAVKVCIKTK